MKIIFSTMIVCIMLALNAVVHAGEMGDTSCINHGLYVGGNVGLLNLNDNEWTSASGAGHQLGAAGINGGGLIGYDLTFYERFKLGAEAFANAVGNSLAAEQLYAPVTSYTAKMRYELGVRLLPAYMFSPCTSVHMILGYADGNFAINDDGDFGYINKQFSQNGFQTGLGVMTSLLSNGSFLSSYGALFLRGDLLYTTYASNSSAGTTTQNQPQTYKNGFATIAGNLALVYQFS